MKIVESFQDGKHQRDRIAVVSMEEYQRYNKFCKDYIDQYNWKDEVF